MAFIGAQEHKRRMALMTPEDRDAEWRHILMRPQEEAREHLLGLAAEVTEKEETPERLCRSCDEVMSEERFQAGKMCCDHPLFGDDEEDEDDYEARKTAGHHCASCEGPLIPGEIIWGCHWAREEGNDCETWYCGDCEDKEETCECCETMSAKAAGNK